MSPQQQSRESAVTLRTLLEKVAAGELDASPRMVRHLEGALLTLEVLSRRDVQRDQP